MQSLPLLFLFLYPCFLVQANMLLPHLLPSFMKTIRKGPNSNSSPASISSIKQYKNEIKTCLNELVNKTDLDKYLYLRNIQDWNEELFYALLISNITTIMPVVYTPIVGLACTKYSNIVHSIGPRFEF